MSKKSSELFCYGCDFEFTVKYDKDETLAKPEYCPFCGDKIEQETHDAPEDSDEESEESDWD